MKNPEKPVKLCEFHSAVLKLCTVCNVMVFIMNAVCNSDEITCSSYNHLHFLKNCVVAHATVLQNLLFRRKVQKDLDAYCPSPRVKNMGDNDDQRQLIKVDVKHTVKRQ